MTHTDIKHARSEREAELMVEIEQLRTEVEKLRRWKALDKPLTAAMAIANSHNAPLRAEIERLDGVVELVNKVVDAKNAEIERLKVELANRPEYDIQVVEALAAKDVENERLKVELSFREPEATIVVLLREEIERLTAERDRYKGTLRFLAGEGITAARNALEQKP